MEHSEIYHTRIIDAPLSKGTNITLLGLGLRTFQNYKLALVIFGIGLRHSKSHRMLHEMTCSTKIQHH